MGKQGRGCSSRYGSERLLYPVQVGGHGAAAATSIALTFETVLLFWIVRQRLGLHVLAFGKRG
jgi:Na+-driven multidrug efflux pump